MNKKEKYTFAIIITLVIILISSLLSNFVEYNTGYEHALLLCNMTGR